EQAAAALQDLLLLLERRIEWNACRLQQQQRQIGSIERVERRGKIRRSEVDGVDRVIGREIARIVSLNALCHRGLVERRVDKIFRKQWLMVTKAHHQERLVGEFFAQALEEALIVLRAHRLPAQILIDIRAIAEVAPAGLQIGPIASVPGEMIGSRIDKEEHRRAGALPGDGAQRKVEIMGVGLLKAAQILGIEEALDAGAGVEAARADKGTVIRIHAEGAIAAMAQRMRQPTIDMTGSKTRDRLGKTPI